MDENKENKNGTENNAESKEEEKEKKEQEEMNDNQFIEFMKKLVGNALEKEVKVDCDQNKQIRDVIISERRKNQFFTLAKQNDKEGLMVWAKQCGFELLDQRIVANAGIEHAGIEHAGIVALKIKMTQDFSLNFAQWPTYLDVYNKIKENVDDGYGMMFGLKYNDQCVNISNFDDLEKQSPLTLVYSRLISAPGFYDSSGVKSYSSESSNSGKAKSKSTTEKVLKAYNIANTDTCMVFGTKFPALPNDEILMANLQRHHSKHHNKDVINCHFIPGKRQKFVDPLLNIIYPTAHKLEAQSTRLEMRVWYVIDYFVELLKLTIFYDPFTKRYFLLSMDLKDDYVTNTFHGKEIIMNCQNSASNENNKNIHLSKRAIGIHFQHCLREAKKQDWEAPPITPLYAQILSTLSDVDDSEGQWVHKYINESDIMEMLGHNDQVTTSNHGGRGGFDNNENNNNHNNRNRERAFERPRGNNRGIRGDYRGGNRRGNHGDYRGGNRRGNRRGNHGDYRGGNRRGNLRGNHGDYRGGNRRGNRGQYRGNNDDYHGDYRGGNRRGNHGGSHGYYRGNRGQYRGNRGQYRGNNDDYRGGNRRGNHGNYRGGSHGYYRDGNRRGNRRGNRDDSN